MDEKHGVRVLTINSGSSSIKFAIYRMVNREELLLSGSAAGIGLASGYMRIRDAEGKTVEDRIVGLRNHDAALREIVQSLNRNPAGRAIDAVGHRLVHGGSAYTRPHNVTPELLARLNELVPFAPDHLPHEIAAINAFTRACRVSGSLF